MNRAYIAGVAWVASLLAGEATADDSSAALGMGGLAFTKSADIRMADEDLSVSPAAVRIRFAFANDSARDIDTVVAFPLPDIDTEQFTHEELGTTTSDPVNFVGFAVKADGKKIVPSVEQRAFLKDRDVTAIVKAAGLPVNVVGNWQALQHLSPAGKAKLKAAGLLEPDDPDNNFPLWTVRTKYYWQQHFPAGKTVVFEQSYQPVTGRSFFSDSELDEKSEDGRFYVKSFCLDDPARTALRQMTTASRKANPQGGGLVYASTTDYVLSTGNNWKGPIGRFHLTLDKLKPDNVLSLCWDGSLKKTGPTTFEDTRTNFAPKSDIKLLVVDSRPPA
jgi:hypothetical protein